MEKNFNFYIPEVKIEKGGKDKQGNDLMIVSGICSTNDEDSDGENLEPIGFNTEPLIKKGFINWNHQAKKDPDAIIGEPIEAKIVDGNKLFVKAVLYSNSTLAKKVYSKIQELEKSNSTRKIGWSIEGIPTLRDTINPKRILKANITGVAITHCPKNAHTAIQICKGEYNENEVEEFDDEDFLDLDKAIEANPDLTNESVEGFTKKKKKVKDEEDSVENETTGNKNKIFSKSQILSIFIKKLPNQDIEIYKSILDSFNSKILNQMENITQDKIEKAIEDFTMLLKGESAIIEKSEDDELPIEKVSTILSEASEMYSKMKVSDPDFAFDELTEGLIREGYTLSQSAKTAQQVIDEFEKNDNGGDTQTVNVQDFVERFGKSFDEKIDKIEKSFNEKFEKLVNDVLIPISKSNANNLLQIKSVEDTIEKSLSVPAVRKSITGVSGAVIERFEKSISNGEKINYSTSEGLNHLKNVIEEQFAKSQDSDLEDAMFQLEGAKMLTSNLAQKLRNKGINI